MKELKCPTLTAFLCLQAKTKTRLNAFIVLSDMAKRGVRHRRSQGGQGAHPRPPPIEMLPKIKILQKRLLFLQFEFLLGSLRTTVGYTRTTVINNNIDPGGPGPFNLIFANQFK